MGYVLGVPDSNSAPLFSVSFCLPGSTQVGEVVRRRDGAGRWEEQGVRGRSSDFWVHGKRGLEGQIPGSEGGVGWV